MKTNKKYSKSHPLWTIYEIQRQILKTGGKIDRHSDLLAYYEGQSLVPDHSPIKILTNLLLTNHSEKTKVIYSLQLICGKEIPYVNDEKKTPTIYEYKRIDIKDKTPEGFKRKAILFLDKKEATYWNLENDLLDNEISTYYSWNDYVVTLNPKYIDILRLIKNGYNQKKYEMKKNKNIIPSIILALGLIIASIIYAFANRYELTSSGFARVDKWTNKIEAVDKK